jgi:hypothetical protein
MWTKEQIRQVFKAQSVLNNNLYHHQLCPSDLTEEEYLDDIILILNDINYMQELIEENELG